MADDDLAQQEKPRFDENDGGAYKEANERMLDEVNRYINDSQTPSSGDRGRQIQNQSTPESLKDLPSLTIYDSGKNGEPAGKKDQFRIGNIGKGEARELPNVLEKNRNFEIKKAGNDQARELPHLTPKDEKFDIKKVGQGEAVNLRDGKNLPQKDSPGKKPEKSPDSKESSKESGEKENPEKKITKESNPDGSVVERAADGRVSRVTHPDGSSKEFTRNPKNPDEITGVKFRNKEGKISQDWDKSSGKWVEKISGQKSDSQNDKVDEKGNYSYTDINGKRHDYKTDGSHLTRNQKDLIEQIDYPNGNKLEIKYDEENKPVETKSTMGGEVQHWKKTGNEDSVSATQNNSVTWTKLDKEGKPTDTTWSGQRNGVRLDQKTGEFEFTHTNGQRQTWNTNGSWSKENINDLATGKITFAAPDSKAMLHAMNEKGLDGNTMSTLKTYADLIKYLDSTIPEAIGQFTGIDNISGAVIDPGMLADICQSTMSGLGEVSKALDQSKFNDIKNERGFTALAVDPGKNQQSFNFDLKFSKDGKAEKTPVKIDLPGVKDKAVVMFFTNGSKVYAVDSRNNQAWQLKWSGGEGSRKLWWDKAK